MKIKNQNVVFNVLCLVYCEREQEKEFDVLSINKTVF